MFFQNIGFEGYRTGNVLSQSLTPLRFNAPIAIEIELKFFDQQAH
jgi:hypothetical protein